MIHYHILIVVEVMFVMVCTCIYCIHDLLVPLPYMLSKHDKYIYEIFLYMYVYMKIRIIRRGYIPICKLGNTEI